MATKKRQRQKQAQHEKADQLARIQRGEVLRQRVLLVVLLAVLGGGALYLLSQDGESDNTFAPELESDTTPEVESDTTPELDSGAFLAPPPGASITGETPCPEPDGSSARTTSFENAPPMCIDPTSTYSAVISTDIGDITVELDAAAAPLTVNNFVVLARYGYYKDVPFHRIIPGFVIQGGDAVGGADVDNTLGGGDPGYSISEEPPTDGSYQVGSLAMAKRGEPGSTGSQFFIITGENGASLPPEYSLFGAVTTGQDVVDELDSYGTAGAGVPTEVVTIRSVSIIEE